ncbi:calcium homeostasis modulator protein 5-like [Nematostella vectensis]|uniref:calcium homeostasis modulator protein 5-like n=1 Tax=Nematostella vectensis TaxID=45351 RepID=UPI0013903FFD|nr:calcium homeostasis modulator protein 5-like [Nematostella vectensis]
MALSLATLVTQFKSVLENQGGTIRNVVMVLLVFGLQAIVSGENLFSCPTKDYRAYGAMFIFVPGLLLFLVAIFLNENFWKMVRGCCYHEGPRDFKKKVAPFLYPRWGCTKKLCEVIFYSMIATCLWVFWAFLHREYYTCAVMGNKAAKLLNTTAQQKVKILEDFQKAADTSQMIAFILLALMLFIPFVILTAMRCCFQRPDSKIPSPYQYKILEADSAVETFKSKMTELAKEQGKRKAEMYFAEKTLSEKNPSEILVKAYEDLMKIEKYPEAFPDLEEYKSIEANAAVAAFKAQAEKAGKERVAVTFVDKSWTDMEQRDPFGVVEDVYDSMVDRYPRSTGDRSQPYIKEYPGKHHEKKKGYQMEITEEV